MIRMYTSDDVETLPLNLWEWEHLKEQTGETDLDKDGMKLLQMISFKDI